MSWYWKPYVPAAKRRANAAKAAAKMTKKGARVAPVRINGRTIANTFWGKAWCVHLESFSDYSNRLPRGRTYVRNGSVVHLDAGDAKIDALVQGSSLYKVKIDIKTLAKDRWQSIVSCCSGEIGSVIELLQGKLSGGVMKVIADRHKGLFPEPKEISFSCSCPDWASMCKHVAAVLYGVGNRLDHEPELLFKLRGVNHLDLISSAAVKLPATRPGHKEEVEDQDLAEVFGIDIVDSQAKPLVKKKTKTPLKRRKINAVTPHP